MSSARAQFDEGDDDDDDEAAANAALAHARSALRHALRCESSVAAAMHDSRVARHASSAAGGGSGTMPQYGGGPP